MQQAPADEKGIAQLQDVIKFVLEEAARQGATQAAADASINQGLGVTTGGTAKYQTIVTPGGGQSIVVPNGNGTSTVIHPDGTVETVPTPK